MPGRPLIPGSPYRKRTWHGRTTETGGVIIHKKIFIHSFISYVIHLNIILYYMYVKLIYVYKIHKLKLLCKAGTKPLRHLCKAISHFVIKYASLKSFSSQAWGSFCLSLLGSKYLVNVCDHLHQIRLFVIAGLSPPLSTANNNISVLRTESLSNVHLPNCYTAQ